MRLKISFREIRNWFTFARLKIGFHRDWKLVYGSEIGLHFRVELFLVFAFYGYASERIQQIGFRRNAYQVIIDWLH